MKNRVAIYARLSREDECKIDGNQESRSIENQIKILSQYASENGFDIYKVYYDDGYSGATLDRPHFQELLKDMKEHKFDTLLVKDVSRLGRTLYKVGELIETIFPENYIRVISLNDKYDSLTYKDDMSIVLRNFLNDYYLKEFKRKCRKARQHYANTKHLNYYPKYGYNYDVNRKEIIDDYSAGIVREIFDCIANKNMTLCQVADKLNNEKVLTRSLYQTQVLGLKPLNKNPTDKWCAEKVWEIAQDYEYCGHSLNWIRHKKEDRILLKNTHLAIIDEETYFKAKRNIQARSTVRTRLNHIGKMLIDVKTNRHLMYAKERLGYNSTYYLRINNLRVYTIVASDIEDVLYKDAINVIKACKLSKDKFMEIQKQKMFKNNEYDIEYLKSQLKKLNEQYSILLENYFSQKVSEYMFDKKSSELTKEINDTENKIDTFGSIQEKLSLLEIKFNKFVASLDNIPVDRKELIRLVIDRVYINDVQDKKFNITIKYKFDID
jgi:DNA invertase Pin-like site-specific DNA recombinase